MHRCYHSIAPFVHCPQTSERSPAERNGVAAMSDWRSDLAAVIDFGGDADAVRPRSDDVLRAEAVEWLAGTAVPALRDVAAELRGRGRRVELTRPGAESVGFVVRARGGARELDLKFRVRSGPAGVRVCARELARDGYREFVREWPLDRPVAEVGAADVIAFVVNRYRAATAGGT